MSLSSRLPWMFLTVTSKYWDDLENVSRYVRWLEEELHIKRPEDWYAVPYVVVCQKGGHTLLQRVSCCGFFSYLLSFSRLLSLPLSSSHPLLFLPSSSFLFLLPLPSSFSPSHFSFSSLRIPTCKIYTFCAHVVRRPLQHDTNCLP